MKITYHTAASITVEVDGIKILCDPWFYPGAFYGSWCQYPPYSFNAKDFDDIDYIYISHTHEDHLCSRSMLSLNKDIPVLIYKFNSPFVKNIIQNLGFEVIEVKHDERYSLTKKAHFKVFSSLESSNENEGKQTAIDTYCLISDGENTFLNTNDNFIENIQDQLANIKNEYDNINFLAHVYTSASCYPQTTISLSEQELLQEKERVLTWCYDRAAAAIKTLNPEYYMPFAGSYLLTGKLAKFNKYKANTTRYDAKLYFEKNYPYMLKDNKCVVLNSGEYFDLKTKEQSKEYVHYCLQEKDNFIQKVLPKVKFDYEKKPIQRSLLTKVNELIPFCYERMEKHRSRLGYSTDTNVYIKLNNTKYIFVSMSGKGCNIVNKKHISFSKKHIIMEMDVRLLVDILKGPRYAHWDNADTGSHISYIKKPNIHEKGVYHVICYFHS